MSLYSDYIMEREGFGCFEDKDSFVTYKKIDDALYLRDMFVCFEKRKTGIARKLVEQTIKIAKRMNCNRVITTIDTTTNNWEVNKKGIESAGFTQVNNEELLYFVKELNNG